MKCPYRKIVTHVSEQAEGVHILPQKDVEEFAECYKRECPFYDEVLCRRVKKEIQGR